MKCRFVRVFGFNSGVLLMAMGLKFLGFMLFVLVGSGLFCWWESSLLKKHPEADDFWVKDKG